MTSPDVLQVAELEEPARRLARAAGFRPAVRHIDWFVDWDAFTAAAHVTRPRTTALRGMTARSRQRGRRCVWLAAHLTAPQVAETATHELAHCMLPWRNGHTGAWLALHAELLTRHTSHPAAHNVIAAAAAAHDLTHPPTTRTPR